jgi:two-component system sensor histidine kinase UhpB
VGIAQTLDAERRRIAAELHDRAGPNLATVALNLRTLEQRLPLPAGAHLFALLAETQALLTETIAEIRDFSAELRPARLDYGGLMPALEERVERYRERTGLDVQLNVQLHRDGDGAARLPAQTEWLVYRVIQEALSNCARHAAASCVVIDLAHEGQFVSLQIRDDGIGFEYARLAKSKQVPGMGLLTMRERVEHARGIFLLHSQPGNGTQIRVTLPITDIA